MSSSLGLHIVDPRILSDQVSDDRESDRPSLLPSSLPVSLSAPPRLSSRPPTMSSSSASSSLSQENLYSNLATFIFGEPHTSDSTYSSSYDSDDEAPDVISPLTTPSIRPGADRTPRPSVSTSSSPKYDSSHPSQGPGRPASNPFPSSSRTANAIRSSGAEQIDEESSEVPSSPDLIPRRGYPHRGYIIPDNVSQQTFGHSHVRSSIASSHSRCSSRTSSRDGLEFSSDEEVEIGEYDGGSSPVTFAHDLDNIDEDAPTFHRHRPLFETRRGSIPMAIPGSSSDALSNRSRESSILTIRRPSRSLDDDLTSHISSHSGEDPATVVPRSGPLTRADFRSLEVQATQQQLEHPSIDRDGTFDGFDISYILSRKSEGSIRSFRSTAQPSFIGRTTAEPSRASHTWINGRRTSTVTLQTNYSGEDTFLRHVGLYGSRSDHWSFLKEKADGLSISTISSARHGRSPSLTASSTVVDKGKQTMQVGTQEIWRCGHVGRYKVDRLTFKPPNADPAKAPQQRINIRHIPDPYLKGTKTGGPSSVIHKHSRAVAFSIFRSYHLFRRGGSSSQSGSRNIHMHTSGGIMFAPRKVQEQYTSTKTTSKLSTHGLLEDGSRKPGGGADKPGGHRGKEKEKEDAKKTKSKDKKKDKDKRNERASHPAEGTESSTATSSAGSVEGSASHFIAPSNRATTSKILFVPPSKTIIKLQPESGTSGPSSPEAYTPDHSSKKLLDEDNSPVSVANRTRGHRGSIDSDERLPTRTPHAEAFGTLDPNDIEHLRRVQKPSDGSSSFSNLNRIFRRLRGVSSRPDSSGSLTPVTSQNAYSPPWIVTAGRDQNEEHVRVIADLNNSFRDVGLLHMQPHKAGPKSSSKKKTGHDIFDYVPEDSLYMLLPLWAGETEPSTNPLTQVTPVPTVLENRQYLLVWYVPFDDRGRKPAQQTSTNPKKKPKQSHSTSDGTGDSHQKNVCLSNFRVNARLVEYKDLRGSGIRVPSDGLAVTAPAWEAMTYDEGAQEVTQMSETVICVCSSREKGFQMDRDGLTKLGLCKQDEPTPASPPVAHHFTTCPSEDDLSDVEVFLTPIGRAAVEMVWLGCLAVTSFG